MCLILNISFDRRLLGYSKPEFAGLQCCSERVGNMRVCANAVSLLKKGSLTEHKRSSRDSMGFVPFASYCFVCLYKHVSSSILHFPLETEK